jgi:hypothetical protein
MLTACTHGKEKLKVDTSRLIKSTTHEVSFAGVSLLLACTALGMNQYANENEADQGN